MTFSNTFRFFVAASASSLALISSGAAYAQSAAPSGSGDAAEQVPAGTDGECAAGDTSCTNTPIVVTGSRIARKQVENASPIEIVDSRKLDARGFQTVAQALNELPTFGIPGASPVGFNQSSFGAGQSFVNFLGLGSQRTLTLVNGRRFVSSNTGSIFGPTGTGGTEVDLNLIPTKLISRVETVAAIGAPIYGSDAVAGTINIILKRDFEGVDIDVQDGFSSRGDAPDQRIRFLAGKNFGGGRGNVTFAAEYNKSRGLLFTDRGLTSTDDRFDAAPSGTGPQLIYRDLRIPSVDPSGVPMVTDFLILSPQQSNALFGDPSINVGVINGQGQTLRFGPDGTLVPVNFGTTNGATDSFSVFTSGGNGYSLRSVENLLTDVERYSTNLNLSYELTDNIRFFGEAWYGVSTGRNLADQPVYNSALFGNAGDPDGNLVISLNNPFLSPTARATIQNAIATSPFSDDPAQDYFYLARANVDLQSGVATGKSEVMRFVGGFDGTLHVLPGRDWQFEAYFNYGRAKVTSKTPQLNQQNFLNALDSVLDGSGNIVCRPGYTNSPAATVSTQCAPINPFGQQISQAARDYVTSIATPETLNHQYDAVASVSGPLFRLPGGDLSFALGYEHRKEDSNFDPGTFFFGAGTGNSSQRTPYGRSVPIDRVFGEYHTNEIFGELNADIVSPANGVPLIYSLSIQTAGRYIWNSTAGNDPTYTVQARWAPFKDIALRGAYTRAVRAPSITEAFNPNSSAFGFATDVCDATLVNQGPDPTTRAANCAAAGVPAGFNSLSNDRSFQTFTFGNSALQNEKADSYTAGLVLTPSFIPGMSATVDYIDIKLKNAITQYGNDDVVEACYDSTTYPNNPFCALIVRNGATADPNTSHQLASVATTFFNSAQLRYKGIVVGFDYRRPTPFLGANSTLDFSVSYQHLITRTDQRTAGSVPVQLDGGIGYSHDKGIASLNYRNGGFDGLIQVNYIGPALVDPTASPNFYAFPRVGAFTYVNLAMTYDVTPRFTIHASVDNLFDAKPPFPYPASGGTGTYFAGVLGTYFRVGAGVHF